MEERAFQFRLRLKALQPGVSPGEDLPLVKLGQTAAAGASAPAGRSD